jgi:UDP-N-acetyl-D-glucosamine/UDP-N-acetyl-D-galactosamine dehydrogenase
MNLDSLRVAVIGLGYVGLPLAVEFGRKRKVVGFDINQSRIDELKRGEDFTLETTKEEIIDAKHLVFTTSLDDLQNCNCFIVTVPTPIDEYKSPDLGPLMRATETVGRVLKKGGLVIYESTVYPGCTEEECVPKLELHSGLVFNKDFFCGYSPERINPGDKNHRLSSIVKLTSGSTPQTAEVVNALYREIITAGTFKTSSIKVAEAAKVIENTQRDVNIALMNELAMIFCRLGLDTLEVLEAAGTKWNFMPFHPGLVGGHCIGVDPYYLTHKAKQLSYYPDMILAGRRINDNMADHVADQIIKMLLSKGFELLKCKVLVLGVSFKKDCPDMRNSKVVDLVRALQSFQMDVEIFDPCIIVQEARESYDLKCLVTLPTKAQYGAVILAVPHQQLVDLGHEGMRALTLTNGVLYDVQGALPFGMADGRL